MEPPRIDLLDAASFAHGQPHDAFRWLRAHAPVYRHAEPNRSGFYAVTRYDDVKAVGRDAATYSSVPAIMMQDPQQGGLDLPDRQIAGDLPSFVTAELLGLPLDDGRRLYELTETIHGAQAAAVRTSGAACRRASTACSRARATSRCSRRPSASKWRAIRTSTWRSAARLPDIEPTAPAEWLPSVFISGPKHMPVRFTPGKRLGAGGR